VAGGIPGALVRGGDVTCAGVCAEEAAVAEPDVRVECLLFGLFRIWFFPGSFPSCKCVV